MNTENSPNTAPRKKMWSVTRWPWNPRPSERRQTHRRLRTAWVISLLAKKFRVDRFCLRQLETSSCCCQRLFWGGGKRGSANKSGVFTPVNRHFCGHAGTTVRHFSIKKEMFSKIIFFCELQEGNTQIFSQYALKCPRQSKLNYVSNKSSIQWQMWSQSFLGNINRLELRSSSEERMASTGKVSSPGHLE